MRPALLNPLFAPVTSLAGVGPKQDKLFRYLLGRDETPRLVDLLLHLPASVIDRRARPKIRDAVPGTVVTLEVTVDRHRPTPGRNRPRAASGLCQRRHRRRGADLFPRPAGLCREAAAGRRQALRLRHRCRCTTAPCRSRIPTASSTKRVSQNCRASIRSIRSPKGLALGSLRRAMAQALQKLPALAGMDQPGSDPPLQVSDVAEALNRVHVPVELTDILPDGPFWSRLAFDELLAGQLALALVRAQLRRPAGDRHAGDGHLRKQDHRRAALFADSLAATGRRRDHRRSAPAGPHAAAAAGRRRIGQDRGGAAGRRRRHRGRQAGGADGADGNPGAPAHQDHHAAGRARRPARRHPHRPREGQGAPRTSGAARRPARSICWSAPTR